MNTLLWIVGGLLLNPILGAAVLAAIDRDQRLYRWYCECPSEILKWVLLQAWPILVWVYYRDRL